MREPLKRLTRAGGAAHACLYRASGGRLGGRLGRAPVLLLTTTGRASGRPRTTPLNYLRDGDDLVVVASFGGSDTHPDWYLNLRRRPLVEVQIGGERQPREARPATPEERARLWPRVVEMYPGYARYQERTSRLIPLVILAKPDS